MNKECFIDIHCHLDLCNNIKRCVSRAAANDVGIIITQGVNFENNKEVLKLARENRAVKAALGLYPIDALNLSDKEIMSVIKFVRENKENISAVGEVGMDFKEDSGDKNKQREVFEKIILLAKEIDKPLIVHSRKAEKECIALLEEAGAKKVIMHCFSGKLSLAKRIVSNNWFISIPASIFYNQGFQHIVKETPAENLFCETDSPYLHPMKERNNEPANVVIGYKKIAEIKNLSINELKKKIFSNYKILF